MSTITIVFLGVALLMLAFIFVDITGKNSNKKVVQVEFIIAIIALLLALITHLFGGM